MVEPTYQFEDVKGHVESFTFEQIIAVVRNVQRTRAAGLSFRRSEFRNLWAVDFEAAAAKQRALEQLKEKNQNA